MRHISDFAVTSTCRNVAHPYLYFSHSEYTQRLYHLSLPRNTILDIDLSFELRNLSLITLYFFRK